MLQAIIYDLDNTIFPVPSIGEKLFGPVFDIIAATGQHNHSMDAIKYAIMRTPFRLVAQRHGFSPELTQAGIDLQETLEYAEPIAPFEDYPLIYNLPGERFLVTTGFSKMQHSKIKQLGIAAHFKEIHVVNPTISSKKEVFAGILQRYGYRPDEVLVVGDDPESEIAAGKDLNIPTVLYDPADNFSEDEATYKMKHYSELAAIVAAIN